MFFVRLYLSKIPTLIATYIPNFLKWESFFEKWEFFILLNRKWEFKWELK